LSQILEVGLLVQEPRGVDAANAAVIDAMLVAADGADVYRSERLNIRLQADGITNVLYVGNTPI
jgi:hypothetical protein